MCPVKGLDNLAIKSKIEKKNSLRELKEEIDFIKSNFLNSFIKLNLKELKEKGYIDLSDNAISKKLEYIINILIQSDKIDSSIKKLLKTIRNNFVSDPIFVRIIKSELLRFIKKVDKVDINKKVDDYYYLFKKFFISLLNLGKQVNSIDIGSYIKIFGFLFGKELINFLNYNKDLKYLVYSFLPGLCRYLDIETVSKFLDKFLTDIKKSLIELLSYRDNLTDKELYNIKLTFIHSFVKFLKNINSKEVSTFIFDNIDKFDFIRRNKVIYSVIKELQKANISGNVKYETVQFLLNSLNKLTVTNLTDKQVNIFLNDVFVYLNKLSNVLPENVFKKLISILLGFLGSSKDKKIDIVKFYDFIKEFNFFEFIRLLTSNFGNIIHLIKRLLDRGIRELSIEDFLFEVFKSNILLDISKKIGKKIVEEVKRIANLDIRQLLEEGRRELLKNALLIDNGKNFLLGSKFLDKNDTIYNLSNSFVDRLIDNFINKLGLELTSGDEKLSKQEIVFLLKKSFLEIVEKRSNLFVKFLKECGYNVDNVDFNVFKKFLFKIVNHPKFNIISEIFIDNFTNIVIAKENILKSFREILEDLKKEFPEVVFSKPIGDNMIDILTDLIYSKEYNKENIYHILNFLEKNGININFMNKDDLEFLLLSIPKYINKTKLNRFLKDLYFNARDGRIKSIYDLLSYKVIQDDLKEIIVDLLYSSNFNNKKNLKKVLGLFNKDLGGYSELLINILPLLPEYIDKINFKGVLFKYDLRHFTEQKVIYQFIIDVYKIAEDKYTFLHNLIEVSKDFFNEVNRTYDYGKEQYCENNALEFSDEQLNFLVDFIDVIKSSLNDDELSGIICDFLNLFGLNRYLNIKVFNLPLDELIVYLVRSVDRNGLKEIIYFFLKNKDLNLVDNYDKILSLVIKNIDIDKFSSCLKESIFTKKYSIIFENIKEILNFVRTNEEKILYLFKNRKKFLDFLNNQGNNINISEAFVRKFSKNLFDVVHSLTNLFNKNEFKKLVRLSRDKNIIKGINFGETKFSIENSKGALIRHFIANNFIFSLKVAFKYIFNGFKIDKISVLYDYFKDYDNINNFQDTFLSLLEEQKDEWEPIY